MFRRTEFCCSGVEIKGRKRNKSNGPMYSLGTHEPGCEMARGEVGLVEVQAIEIMLTAIVGTGEPLSPKG